MFTFDTTPIYKLSRQQPRWVNPENFDGKPHSAGRANHGRKGSPCRGELKAGETWELLNAKGNGTVRRMWFTMDNRGPQHMRGLVLRMYWDGCKAPAVEVPLGDFCCNPLGRPIAFESALFTNPEGRSFNVMVPMPFRKSARITVANESDLKVGMFWNHIDYTLGDRHGAGSGYFHAHFRREHPTTLRRDFTILPAVKGRGRFIGASFGVIADTKRYDKNWWGEGEVKIFMDGDKQFPTLCGTGTEDYICSAWGQGQFSQLWYGCPLADHEKMQFSFYRFHGPDPVNFQKSIRATIHQIGWAPYEALLKCMIASGENEITLTGDGTQKITRAQLEADAELRKKAGLFERQDDWSSVAYFYLDKPQNGLPTIQSYAERVKGLIEGK